MDGINKLHVFQGPPKYRGICVKLCKLCNHFVRSGPSTLYHARFHLHFHGLKANDCTGALVSVHTAVPNYNQRGSVRLDMAFGRRICRDTEWAHDINGPSQVVSLSLE